MNPSIMSAGLIGTLQDSVYLYMLITFKNSIFIVYNSVTPSCHTIDTWAQKTCHSLYRMVHIKYFTQNLFIHNLDHA
jgi:hypothetical protein